MTVIDKKLEEFKEVEVRYPLFDNSDEQIEYAAKEQHLQRNIASIIYDLLLVALHSPLFPVQRSAVIFRLTDGKRSKKCAIDSCHLGDKCGGNWIDITKDGKMQLYATHHKNALSGITQGSADPISVTLDTPKLVRLFELYRHFEGYLPWGEYSDFNYNEKSVFIFRSRSGHPIPQDTKAQAYAVTETAKELFQASVIFSFIISL